MVTLTEKGIDLVGPQASANLAFGGIAVFLLAWICFDGVANGCLKNTDPSTIIFNRFGHFGLMLAGVVVGVVPAGEIKVGFWEPHDAGYATLGCFGLAAYLLLLGLVQGLIEDREPHRFARRDAKLCGAGDRLLVRDPAGTIAGRQSDLGCRARQPDRGSGRAGGIWPFATSKG